MDSTPFSRIYETRIYNLRICHEPPSNISNNFKTFHPPNINTTLSSMIVMCQDLDLFCRV
jgi:hypothetical protein